MEVCAPTHLPPAVLSHTFCSKSVIVNKVLPRVLRIILVNYRT